MGVRGLTTFIARSSNKYLENYKLHDTYIVIDGNNIASHLYKWHCTRNDCFGGDYDKYAKTVLDFFTLLEQCNVTPLIVFDGGYEDKKLKTVYSRLKNRVKTIKHLNSVTQGSVTAFPLFVRDLFVEIVVRLGLKAVRCDFEADYEMACLARRLKCPLLSYDSDFYVFDVFYIPFSSFEMETHKLKDSCPPSYFICCRMYKIENFLHLYGGLDRSNLPLIATLLGNDYIKKSVFSAFYNHIKLVKRKRVRSDQHRKIISIIKWMQNETYDSAVRKILGRLKTKDRKHVAEKIKSVTEGYICSNSELISYLHIDDTEKDANCNSTFTFDTEKILREASLEFEDGVDKDSVSDSSENDSESTECSGDSTEPLEEPITESVTISTKNVPQWFKDKFRKCEYPAAFMDILLRNKYFCTPQIEDYDNIHSHHISVFILAAINKILSSGNVETLKYTARNENAGIRTYTTPSCDVQLPTLMEIKAISSHNGKAILLKVLNISSKNMIEFLEALPESWQLYILSIVYWIKNAKPTVAYCHVYSLVLCMFVLNKIDLQVGFYRSNSKFSNKFETKLNLLRNSRISEDKKLDTKSSHKFIELLNGISYDDSLLCLKELISYFQMEERMKTHLKLFDIHILDCFAQFQSCFLHIKYLNLLLNKPFDNCLISDFYDGTFMYNMCVNLRKRTNIDAYLQILLQNGPTVLNCLKVVIEMLKKIVSGDIATVTVGKRKRRRKKNSAATITDVCNEEIDESESDTILDVNNRFSLLNLVK